MNLKLTTLTEEIASKLSEKEKVQFPFFIKMCFALFFLYIVVAIVLVVLKTYIGAASVGAGTIFFFFTISLLRNGKMQLATWSATIGLLFAQVICMYILDVGGNPYGVYRMAAYSVFLSLAQFLLCSRIREIIIFQIASVILLTVRVVLLLPKIAPADTATFFAAVPVTYLVMIVSTVILIINFKMIGTMNDKLVKEKEHVNSAFNQIEEVVNESKQGLETGAVLSQKAATATEEVANIHNTVEDLRASSVQLSAAAANITQAFVEIEKDAVKMQKDTSNQNSAISESSAALTEIAANLSNINEITSQRSSNMNTLISSLNGQKEIIQEALSAVNDVKSSSNDISSFVHTVEEIANQTGLLAMNASIEAAHAGSQGKGFAVIAQEIRKLSEETSKNSTHIAEVLTSNEKTVEKAASAVTSFATLVDHNTQELQDTMQSLEGILMGISEMNIGTRSVMNSLQEIVETSKHNEEAVEGVSSKITVQKEEVSGIEEFIKVLESSIVETDTKIQSVQILLTDIKNTSDENIEMSVAVSKSLESINV